MMKYCWRIVLVTPLLLVCLTVALAIDLYKRGNQIM